jgi:PKHD-type hydroxylase
MIYLIDLLDNSSLEKLNKIFDRTSSFSPAYMSKGEMKTDIKNTTEMDKSDPYYAESINIVKKCIEDSIELQELTACKQYGSFLFSQYSEGMFYGNHVDYHTQSGVRTDYSCTVFLSDKNTYEGGELVINLGNTEQFFKLDAGQAIIYPTSFVHRVNEVKSGIRRACIFWVESRINDSRVREINSDLFQLIYKYEDEIRHLNRDLYNRLVSVKFNLFKHFCG